MVQSSTPFRIDEVAGSQPVILLFAPSERSPAYENQMTLLSKETIVGDLNAVLVRAFADGPSYVHDERLDESSVEELRMAYHVDADDFLIVFIAIDGSEMHRSDAPVQASVILERFTNGSQRKDTY